ncbi:hypothetical protein V1525DRAFT_338744 [Lipomyces kononenkoae]|uniref:Uncharacterized protein n=1 Tax=Lipomyces kononenkoae TaxID=34357 RepID=A0ACC3T6X0_LIPKO
MNSMKSLWEFIKKWKYRYEVTMPLYAMTPMEQLILNSLFFIGVVFLAIALYKYAPVQIQLLAERAYYYYTGVDSSASLDHDKASSIQAGGLSTGTGYI